MVVRVNAAVEFLCQYPHPFIFLRVWQRMHTYSYATLSVIQYFLHKIGLTIKNHASLYRHLRYKHLIAPALFSKCVLVNHALVI